MLFYADEDFALPVVIELRRLGHDVLTVQENARQGDTDVDILVTAHRLNRAVLTYNRRHFERLHRSGQLHSGIMTCTRDINFIAQAARIHNAVGALSIGSWCLRVNRRP